MLKTFIHIFRLMSILISTVEFKKVYSLVYHLHEFSLKFLFFMQLEKPFFIQSAHNKSKKDKSFIWQVSIFVFFISTKNITRNFAKILRTFWGKNWARLIREVIHQRIFSSFDELEYKVLSRRDLQLLNLQGLWEIQLKRVKTLNVYYKLVYGSQTFPWSLSADLRGVQEKCLWLIWTSTFVPFSFLMHWTSAIAYNSCALVTFLLTWH